MYLFLIENRILMYLIMPIFLEGDGEAPRRNQRVALGDMTNFEAGQLEIEGKPPVQINRPITRRFHTQLLANNAKKNTVVITLDNASTSA